MSVLNTITCFVNILLIIIFIGMFILKFQTEVSPKKQAFLGTTAGVCLLLYLILMTMLTFDLIWNQKYEYLGLIVFIAAPFVIGEAVRFKTLKIFSIMQILTFIMSFIILVQI